MKIGRQINMVVVLSMGFFLVVSILLSMLTLNNLKNTEIEKMRETLLTERKNKLNDVVQNAYSVLETAGFYEPAKNAITNMRFGENKQNYFFVVDYSGMFWVNPAQPELVGKISQSKDAKGNDYIKQIISEANIKGEGFIKYQDFKPGSADPSVKLVHYKKFEEWKWVVCAGEYIDDIDRIVSGNARDLQSAMLDQFILMVICGMLAMIMAVLFSSRFFMKKLVLPIRVLTEAVEKITGGDYTGKINVRAGEEISRLAEALTSMQMSFAIAYKRLKTLTAEHHRVNRAGDDDEELAEGQGSAGKTKFVLKHAINA